MDLCNQTELYEKLNLLLKEREESYCQREEAMQEHQEALKSLEERLLSQKQDQDQRELSLSALQGQLELEKGNLEQFKLEVSRDLEELIQKKVNFQELENARLQFEGEREAFLMEKKREQLGVQKDAGIREENKELKRQVDSLQREKSSLLKKLGETLQMRQPDYQAEAETQTYAVKLQEPKVNERVEKEKSDRPNIIERLGILARESISDIMIQEFTRECFLASVGDKKLQFLLSEPPTARILVKREESKELHFGIKQLNRSQEIWKFSFAGGLLMCTMSFPEEMEPELILEKCKDALTRYFKSNTP